MSSVGIADSHPDAVFYRDAAAGQVVLNSGDRVPVLAYLGEDGDRLQPYQLHGLDEFRMVYGPLPSGKVVQCYVWPRRMGLAA